MTDSVALLLKELRLPAFHRHYQSLWKTAIEKNWSHTDYLAALCEYELSDRYQRRTQKWLREAKLAAAVEIRLGNGPGQGANPQDKTLALGHGDGVAGVKQIESV